MRRWCYVLVVLFALLTAFGGRAMAQSPGESGCGRLILRTNAAGSFDTLCLGDAGATLAVAPNGTRAAMTGAVAGQPVVEIVDLKSGAVEGSVAISGGGFASHLTFSPDSARLAIATSGNGGPTVFVDDLASGSVSPLQLDDRAGAVYDLLWTPDGSVLTAVLPDFSVATGATAIAALDPTGAQPPRFLLPYGPLCIYGLAWSPNGQTLAFAAGGLQNPCGDPSLDGIYALDAASGATTRLTTELAANGTSWTSDGRVLAETFSRAGLVTQRVALFGIDGSATYFSDPLPTACTEIDGAAQPQEAEGLLLYQATDGNAVLVNLASGQQQLLSIAGPSTVHTPLLSPDGSNVAYTEQVGVGTDGYQTVVRIDAVGGATVAQTIIAGTTLTLDSWLPDGTGLVARAESGEHELCPAGS
jgi:Tol biopolymer transport system component